MKSFILSFTLKGGETASKIRDLCPELSAVTICMPAFADQLEQVPFDEPLRAWVGRHFAEDDLLVFIGAAGIAVRLIAPHIQSKDTDPAVVVVDEDAGFVIPILSGHLGGANEYAELIAERMDAVPVITTATDVRKTFSVDTWAKKNGLHIDSLTAANKISAAVLSGKPVGFFADAYITVKGEIPGCLKKLQKKEARSWEGELISVSARDLFPEKEGVLPLVPSCVTLGIGCRRDTDPVLLRQETAAALAQHHIFPESIGKIASIDIKKYEKALTDLAENLHVPFETFTAEELAHAEGAFASSDFVKQVAGVDNVCERAASLDTDGGTVLMEKHVGTGMTAAAYAACTEVTFWEN